MAAISGKATNIGFDLSELADTYGTAEAVSAKMVVESIDYDENPQELIDEGIGSGGFFATNALAANEKPSISWSARGGYNNGLPHVLAQFFGSTAAPVEQTGGQGDYLHRITFNTTLNRVWLTMAYESSSTTVIEFPSVTVQNLTLTAANPTSWLEYAAEGLASQVVKSAPTNNNATLQGLSVTDTELTKIQQTTNHAFWINAQAGGAASSGDKLNVTSWVLNLTRPQEIINEIKGSSGNSAPVEAGTLTGTLTIQLKNHVDNTWEIAQDAGTEYKSVLHIDGSQIGTGVNKKYSFYIPRMVPIVNPQYSLSSPGTNPTVITFRILDASANPTGMNSKYPYVDVINARSTAYIS